MVGGYPPTRTIVAQRKEALIDVVCDTRQTTNKTLKTFGNEAIDYIVRLLV